MVQTKIITMELLTLQLIYWELVTVVAMILHANFDSERNGYLSMRNKPIRFVVRTGWLCTIFWVMGGFSWEALNIMVITGAYCWLGFDYLYNRFEDNHWMYIGDTSRTEKIAKKVFNKNTYFVFKLLLLAASMIALPWVAGINQL